MARVQLENVWKRYPDGTEAVKSVDLDIQDGEFVILVGPSGCGKSTTLRMIAGLETISEGKLMIGDQVVNDLSPKERDIAMVFQSYALYPHMSVFDNMAFALKLAKVDKSDIEKRVNDAADTLGLKEYLHRKPKALSGGQRQRVAMGRAIVRSPQAFLMDEPLSNLDAKLRVQMRAEIADLQNRLGVTTIYVTHDQVEAMTMGDRVAVLKRGVLMQADAPQKLYDRPDNLFVAGFMGSPSMNIAEATVVRGDGDEWAVKLGGQTLPLGEGALELYPGLKDYKDKKVAFGIRPEDLTRPKDNTRDYAQWGDRKVTLVEMLGAEMLCHFDVDAPPIVTEDMREAVDDDEAFERLKEEAQSGGQTWVARFDPIDKPTLGEPVTLAVNTNKAHFFDMESGAALR